MQSEIRSLSNTAWLAIPISRSSRTVWRAALYAGGPAFSSNDAAVAAVAVFLGHLYPVFYKFQGGKGVATAAGVLLALNPWLGLGVLLTWAAIAACFRYSSLAAIVAA